MSKQSLLALVRSDAALTFVLACAYFQLVWGLGIVNPENVDWMLAVRDDLTLYLTTTNYYRFSEWQFPITAFDTLFYPTGANIALADGIPLLAVPFKLLDPILPKQILQYYGLWFLACVWLQALIAKGIFRTLKLSLPLQWLGTLLILADLPLVANVWHGALWARWTFLFGFYLYLQPELPIRRTTLLATLMPWIHPYLLVMVCGTLFATFIHHRRAPKIWRAVLYALVGLFISFWLVGYFSFVGKQTGFTGIVLDLAGLFDPGERASVVLQQLKPTRLFDEGFAYLGLGGILLLCLVLARPFIRPLRERSLGLAPLLVVCLLMAIYALGPEPTFRGEPVGVPAAVARLAEPITSKLRVPGRFVWPLWHLIMILGMATVHQLLEKRKWAYAAAGAVVGIQLLDVGPWLVTAHDHTFDYPGLAEVDEEIREQLSDETQLLLFHPDTICRRGSPRYRGTWSLALFGAANRLKTNSDFHAFARGSSFHEVCEFTRRLWSERASHPEIIYVHPRFVPRK